MSDRVGQQFGNYRLVTLLGQGGFAEVYLGQHVRLSLQAAIKVLHAYLTGSEAEHFQQEAETIASLMHLSIVRILDYDVQDGVPFLIMDYAPGGSLRRRYPKGTIVPLPEILSTVKQVAAGLQYAHERKFIHRDVKPENMLVGRHEEVLLSDFGLAALAHSSGSLSTQEAIGTLAYMAPEQIEGHPRAASDQYALGVVVYEWLCGNRPFEGSATEVMVQQLTMPPPPLHEKVATIPLGVEQVVLRALAKEPKDRFASVADFAATLEQASQPGPSHPVLLPREQPAPSPVVAPSYATVEVAPDQLVVPTEATPSAERPVGAFGPTVYPGSTLPADLDTPSSQAAEEIPLPGHFVAPMAAALPSPLEPTMPVHTRTRRLSGSTAWLLIALVALVIAGGVLGSLSLLAHFGVLGTRTNVTTISPARGGTWTIDSFYPPDSLIPNGAFLYIAYEIDQALYLPLFYGDAQGVIHPAAASEVPTLQNGGINADATTWTFHVRPHLVWSDGQPYDARDVDYTWNLWRNPKFGAQLLYGSPIGLQLISSAVVSSDHLSITFHLKQPYTPFLQYWMDGGQAPLPMHHFSTMAPEQILKSPDNLNPQVTSGPFLMAESAPANHFTLVRNPRYYLASEGLPYLDKVVFRIETPDSINAELRTNTIDSTAVNALDVKQLQVYKRLNRYTLVTPPASGYFEGLWFNFHNTVLASHLEVRQAIATAIDYQALIKVVQGIASQQCTDHSSFYDPGFDPGAPCPIFDPAAANQLLDNNGWVRGTDGVRTKGGQRLEFEYSSGIEPTFADRLTQELIVQRDLKAIGIKLDIQNYSDLLFLTLLAGGKASPPTGALAGRYDIAQLAYSLGYDPDDSGMLSCNQFPPQGQNVAFYCNPALDALYKQELATPDRGERQNIFEQIHLIYLTDFPIIVLFGLYDVFIVRKGTHNFRPSPVGGDLDDNNIWEWWCDGGKC